MIKQICGIDIGNGYVKGIIKSPVGTDEIDIPSGVSIMTRPNYVPVKGDNIKDEVENLFDRLDASFVTPLVPDTYRRLFGTRSLSSTGAFEEFDVVGNISKANQSLSKSLALGVIAAKAVKDYYKTKNHLPESDEVLAVDVCASLALPIVEYALYKSAYASSFKDTVHTVNIHNFENCITVKIKFSNVTVIAEGASAQFAILAKGEPLMNAMLADLKRRDDSEMLNDITAGDVLSAKNLIGIDIGEGTVNFVVFSDGRFNTDSSTTLNKGYGSVLNNALRSMQEQNFSSGFNTRKQLASYMQAGPSPLKKNHYKRVKSFVDSETLFFSRDVAQKFGHILSNVGGNTEVCYVYGGGANEVKEVLYPLLLEKVKEAQGEDSLLVLYLDSRYSRNLNREGLFIVAEKVNSDATPVEKPEAKK